MIKGKLTTINDLIVIKNSRLSTEDAGAGAA